MLSATQALTLSYSAVRLAAAREAIARLGLLVPEAEGVIYHLLDEKFELPPRARCLAYRKEGEQLTPAEKKGLGLRSNALLSKHAWSDISHAGLGAPLLAHETVLLRATFTCLRYRTLVSAQSLPAPFQCLFQYDMLQLDCPECRRLDGTITALNAVHLFPPADCVCETANYGLRPHVDWLAGVK